jgi:Phosphotriesterase family
MRAVAAAHHQTSVPITVHTHPGSRTGLEVKRVLRDSAGVEPGRVVLGHSGDTTDCDHLAELADAGFMLGMDRFGLNVATTFEARADTLVEMCRRGYAERMVLSQDAACYIDWIDPIPRRSGGRGRPAGCAAARSTPGITKPSRHPPSSPRRSWTSSGAPGGFSRRGAGAARCR